jgi:hypothetical protein
MAAPRDQAAEEARAPAVLAFVFMVAAGPAAAARREAPSRFETREREALVAARAAAAVPSFIMGRAAL